MNKKILLSQDKMKTILNVGKGLLVLSVASLIVYGYQAQPASQTRARFGLESGGGGTF